MFLVTPLHSRMHVIFYSKNMVNCGSSGATPPPPYTHPKFQIRREDTESRAFNTQTHRLSTVEGCNRRKMNG